ncbi:MAG: bifunctional 3-(3-hydroxy-phenyl)propionate/3-hydroxycinnamic acid hydroxylase [Chloroflexota bacterium]
MQKVDVVVVGCGPAGGVAANLLGKLGYSVIALEAALEFHNETRAIHMDHEAMRILQSINVDKMIENDITPFLGMEFVDENLERIFLLKASDPESGEQGYMFGQPALELALRKRLADWGGVELRLGCKVTDIEKQGDDYIVSYRDSSLEKTAQLSSKYVIGADGSSSFTRKHFQIELENLDFDEPWVVVDGLLTEPVDLPKYGQQVCDIARPKTFIPGENNHRRWEIMVLPEEELSDVLKEDFIYDAIAPWGVSRNNYTIRRSAYYIFHALIAQTWHHDNFFLIGDACHQTPPFLGQGMCAGLRDASNIAWKIDLVERGLAGKSIFNTYQQERYPHVRAVFMAAIEQGKIICTIDPEVAKIREHVLDDLSKQEGLSFYDVLPNLEAGLLQSDEVTSGSAGVLSPQPRVKTTNGEIVFLDRVAGDRFRMIVKEDFNPEELDDDLKRFWNAISGHVVCIDPNYTDGSGITGVEDVDGRLGDFFTSTGCGMMLVRPDHYIFGTAKTNSEISGLLQNLRTQLRLQEAATTIDYHTERIS